MSGAELSPEMHTSTAQPECTRIPNAAFFMIVDQHSLRREPNLFYQLL